MLNTKSLLFMRTAHPFLEQKETRCTSVKSMQKFVEVKTVEEHHSGINQIVCLNRDQFVTVSDDCTLKFWSTAQLKVYRSHNTETITCLDFTGPGKSLLIAACHSGNLLSIKTSSLMEHVLQKEFVENAHYNLIRGITSLKSLDNKFYLTADVCGFLKVWASTFVPKKTLELQLDGAISYNSVVEVTDALPTSEGFRDQALIAVGLKTHVVELVVLAPSRG